MVTGQVLALDLLGFLLSGVFCNGKSNLVALHSQPYLPNLPHVFPNHLPSVFPADLLPHTLPALLLVLPFLRRWSLCCFPRCDRSFFHCSHNIAAANWFPFFLTSSLVFTHQGVDYGAGTQEISTEVLVPWGWFVGMWCFRGSVKVAYSDTSRLLLRHTIR